MTDAMDVDTPRTKVTDSDTGILQPPSELKSIIDKTAVWVARNGTTFEAKVAENQKNNPQFAFLRPGNGFYAYYQQKVREIRREEGIAAEGDTELVNNAAEMRLQIKKVMLGEVPFEEVENGAAPKKKKKAEEAPPLEQPPPEEWVVEKPSIPLVQDDMIKLTAQYVARNGRAFQNGLLARENNNPQFGFLQPFHPLHGYFKTLVQQYTNVLLVERGTLEALEALSLDKQKVVERVMKKVRWERAQKKTTDQRRKEEEAERNAMAEIDWHDFTIVQTIEYEDEATEVELTQQPENVVPTPTLAPSAPASISTAPETVEEPEEVNMDVDMDVEEEMPPVEVDTSNVRSDFNPRARPATPLDGGLRFVTPSGQQVDLKEMEEHMKIELSNARALEERKRREQAEHESNLVASGKDILSSLRGFAGQRPDLFVSAENKKKAQQPAPAAVWDGHAASIQRVTSEALHGRSMSDQIKAIHESKGLAPQEPSIGPMLGSASASAAAPPAPQSQQPPQQPPPFAPFPPPGAPPIPFNPYASGPPGGYEHPRPSPTNEPPMKRARMDESDTLPGLMSENQWLSRHPQPVTAAVKVPDMPDKAPWKLNGQVVHVNVNVGESIKTLKEKLADELAMPANKQKLSLPGVGVLNDAKTLAYYNVPSTEIELGVKERGGRKK